MEELKKIDKRDRLRVVTSNGLIVAEDLADLSLNARKLFYVAISQCRKGDTEFYKYKVAPTELAEMWGISRQQIYQTIDKTTTELMKVIIRTIDTDGKSFKKRHLFETCDYTSDKILEFKLNSEMIEMLLGLNKNFSKPLMWEFMRMRSPYSMAVWHLMQKEMHSLKPMMTAPIEFDLTLEELRKVTGTEKKLKQISQFKERVLDKALREIKENCLVNISYTNIKRGRSVIGFRFTAENFFGTIRPENMTLRQRKIYRKGQLINLKSQRPLTYAEDIELQQLTLELDQMSLEDFY
jgi:plasmid replication initiation protein